MRLSLIHISSILLIEGFGLWIGAAWAEYMVVISTGIFLPEEFLSMIHHFTWPRVAILAINAAILVYVVTLVWHRYLSLIHISKIVLASVVPKSGARVR